MKLFRIAAFLGSSVLIATSVLGTSLPSHAALTTSQVSVDLVVSGSNLSSTLTWTSPAPTRGPSAGQLSSGEFRIEQVRIGGHSSPVSRSVGTTDPHGGASPSFGAESNLSATYPIGSLSNTSDPYLSVCWWVEYEGSFPNRNYVCSASIPNPAIGTISSQPALSLTGHAVNSTLGTWTASGVEHDIFACPAAVSARTQISNAAISGCNRLSGPMGNQLLTDLSTARLAGTPNAYNRATHGDHIVLQSKQGSQFVWTASVLYTGASSSNPQLNPGTTPAPTKYEGPEFLGLVTKGVLAGSSHQLEGKNLDKVTSIEVDGKVAKFEALSKTELKFDVPEGLAPGVYDLVINYSGGKLTHLRGLEVKEGATPTKFSTVTKGLDTESAFKEHREYAASQDSKLNKARCIVNAPSLATAQIRAERLCKLIGFSNKNIKSFIIEPKSTVTGNSIYARVHYGADY